MCGNGENVYGIIAGLVAAAAMLVMAFADKHGGAHATAPAHHVVAQAVQVVSPISVDIQRAGAHLDINLRV
jgi:hypothetical protein